MAGVYFHIPFCKQLCHYCDFHKEILHSGANNLYEALEKEIEYLKAQLEVLNNQLN